MQLEYSDYLDPAFLTQGLAPAEDEAGVPDNEAVCRRLCAFYAAMKRGQPTQDPQFQPAGEWRTYHDNRETIYAAWLQKDIPAVAKSLANFWRNELGGIVKQYATLQTLQADACARDSFADAMAHDFMVWRNLFTDRVSALAVPNVGNPWGYVLEGVKIAPKALRYHALSSQIRSILSDAARPVVVEIGAGYCGMAYFLLRDCPSCCYLDFDLPETLMLGAYYLLCAHPDKKILLYGEEPLTASALETYDAVLMPNWAIDQFPAMRADLVLNTFSLSEMPPDVISEYIRQIERICSGYFLHNNMDREGVQQYGHPRTPCARYPIDPAKFKLIYKKYDLFQRKHFGRDGDYRECLYERTRS